MSRISRRKGTSGSSKKPSKVAKRRLAPRSKASLRSALDKQKAQVQHLRLLLQRAKNPEQRSAIQRRLDVSAGQLANLVAGAKQKVRRSKSTTPPGTKKVSGPEAQAAAYSVASKIDKVSADLKKLKPLLSGRKGDTAVRQHAQTQTRMLNAQRAELRRRLGLLKKGLDTERPRKLSHGQSGVARPKLDMPKVYEVPKPTDVSTAIRLVGAQVPRRSGEDTAHYRHRLRAYTQRALVRFANKRATEKIAAPEAIRSSVQETLHEDAPSIESEAQAGGISEDAAAELMDAAIIPVEGQLHAAVEDFGSRPPSAPPSSEETDMLLLEADAAAAQVTESNIDDVSEASGGTPFYKEPLFLAGAVAVTGLVLWAVKGND